jgi:hypothetical protein
MTLFARGRPPGRRVAVVGPGAAICCAIARGP